MIFYMQFYANQSSLFTTLYSTKQLNALDVQILLTSVQAVLYRKANIVGIVKIVLQLFVSRKQTSHEMK